jgi:TRAP-type C4-dicarboxylate transport system substrate-binding protein
MKTKKVLSLSLFVLIICFSFNPASAKTFRLTVAGAVPPQVMPQFADVDGFWCTEVAKRVEQETGDKIMWKKLWAGAVAKMGDNLEAIEGGITDIGLLAPIFENPHLFSTNYGYFAPFGTTDIEMAQRVNNKVWNHIPWLRQVFEKRFNQKVLANTTYESYELLTTFPVKRLEDLKGRKIAAAGPNFPWIEMSGVVPVQSNLAEAYMGLQTGVYEGWIMTPSYTYAFKLHEVAKYHTNVGFGCISGIVLTMNLDSWKALPEAVQKIFLEVSKEYSFVQATHQAEKSRRIEGLLKAEAVQFHTISAEEKRKWMNQISDLPRRKAEEGKKHGQPTDEILKYYIEELEREGYKWPLKWELK